MQKCYYEVENWRQSDCRWRKRTSSNKKFLGNPNIKRTLVQDYSGVTTGGLSGDFNQKLILMINLKN
jgi:hypothetical protein